VSSRLKTLLALLAAAGLFGVWLSRRPEAPPPAKKKTRIDAVDAEVGGRRSTSRGAASRGRREAEPVTQVVELRLEDLHPSQGEFHATRNPFTFYTPPPPPPPPRKGPTPAELEAQRAALDAARQAAIAAKAEAIAHPKPPPITMRYLGSFGPPGQRIAVFSNNGTIYNALEGDVLEGKFRLVSIGYESVDIAFVDFPEIPPEQLPVGQEGS
jgi:hypothetical protein